MKLLRSAPPPRKQKRFYRPELDVLRLIAFLLVFADHKPRLPLDSLNLTTILNAARVGLPLFFLLSAFLITELLLREREVTGTIHIGAFYIRRALRILPLYLAAIAANFLIAHFARSFYTPAAALPYLLLMTANIFVSHHGFQFPLISPLWSLSIEEQFYLVIPSLTRRGGVRLLRWAAVFCLILSYAVLAWLGYKRVAQIDVVWVNSFVQFQFFAAGTLIALILHRRAWTLSWLTRGALLSASIALVYFSERIFHLFGTAPAALPDIILGHLMILAGCVAFFLALLHARLHAPGWVTYLGKISYGLYVFHCFAIGIENLALKHGGLESRPLAVAGLHLLCLPLTILLASISYRFFEQPILRRKERYAYIQSGAETPPAPAHTPRRTSVDPSKLPAQENPPLPGQPQRGGKRDPSLANLS